jgi:hypothetical protein
MVKLSSEFEDSEFEDDFEDDFDEDVSEKEFQMVNPKLSANLVNV